MRRGPRVDRATRVLRVPAIRALREAEQEHAYVLGLDSELRVLVVHLVAVGTVDVVYPHARDVFRELIRHNCVKFIYVHNHPGGGAVPSVGDQMVTQWLRQAGRWLGIPLLAHVLVPAGRKQPVDVDEPEPAPSTDPDPDQLVPKAAPEGEDPPHDVPHEPLPSPAPPLPSHRLPARGRGAPAA